MPKVTVIIPAFNREKFISETLSSVINQTYKELEIILIDDGSTDKTKEIVKKFPMVNYYFQVNAGPSVARNTGMKKATGEYILFLDADDLLLPNAIEKLISVAESNKSADVVYGKASYFKEGEGVPFFTNFNCREGLIFADLLKQGNFIVTGTALVKKNVFSQCFFDANIKHHEDFDFWLNVAYLKFNFKHLNNILINIRLHDDSLGSNLSAMNDGKLVVLENWERKLEGNKKMLSTILMAEAKIELNNKQYFKFIHKTLIAINLDILNIKDGLLQFFKMFLILACIYKER